MVTGCKATPGCIAYVGISYLTQALQAGLGYAQLQNAKGHYELPTPAPSRPRPLLRQEDPGQRDHLADLRPGQRRLPDHQLRVRHRVDAPAERSTAKAIRSVLEWADQPEVRQQLDVPDAGQLPGAALQVEAQSIKQILTIQ